jgi:DNA (cytosine-5)-methyltransferase 1
VIENVPGAPMRRDATLCGTMFGSSLRRHRWFESSVVPPALLPASCDHARPITGVYGHTHVKSGAWRHGKKKMLPSDAATWSREMGIDWMTTRELAQAIPPAYTAWIGTHLIRALQPEEVAS